jgi:hypothetical protein
VPPASPIVTLVNTASIIRAGRRPDPSNDSATDTDAVAGG